MNVRRSTVSLLLLTLGSAASGFAAVLSVSTQISFSSQLERVMDVNSPFGNALIGYFSGAVGTDSLADGQVTLGRNRQVRFQLDAAATSVSYTAMFCRFGFAANPGCVTIGQVPTNSQGDADVTLDFPPSGIVSDTWAGSFVLMRNVGSMVAQFVSGFDFPPTPPPTSKGVEVQLTGQIMSFNSSNQSFRLVGLPIDIFTDGDTTRFTGGGVHNVSDLKVGNNVQITGFSQVDFTIFATQVRVIR